MDTRVSLPICHAGSLVTHLCRCPPPPCPAGSLITDLHEPVEAPATLSSAQEGLLEEMAPYDNYIMGMLTTYAAGLPLDRLHSM